MYQSKYFEEKANEIPKNIVNIGIAIAVVFLTVFLICWGMISIANNINSDEYVMRCKSVLGRYDIEYKDDIKYIGKTGAMAAKRNATVYMFRGSVKQPGSKEFYKSRIDIDISEIARYEDALHGIY
jgi:hypothetical protein